MNLTPVEDILKAIRRDNTQVFKRVEMALDPSVIVKNGAISQDTAFLVPIAESAVGGDRTTQHFSQDINLTFAVIIAVRAVNDRLGGTVLERLDTIKQSVRQALLGTELEEYDDIEFMQGELLSFDNGGAFWYEQYMTQLLFTQEQ